MSARRRILRLAIAARRQGVPRNSSSADRRTGVCLLAEAGMIRMPEDQSAHWFQAAWLGESV